MHIEQSQTTQKTVLQCIILTAIYYVFANVGLALAFEQDNISPVWPPTGIALAALLTFGFRLWPGIFLGALLTNLSTGSIPTISVYIAIGNTLEALSAAYLINRFADKMPFTNVMHTTLFILFIVISTTISASIGVTTLFLNGIINTVNAPTLWETWWLGDLVGGLIVTPFLLIWKNPSPLSLAKQRLPEISALSVVTLSLIFMIFSSQPLTENSSHLLVLLLLPLLAWTATRFHRHGVTLIMIIISTSSIISTIYGFGPFVMATENESLLLLQASVGAAMVTALMLVASQEERILAHSIIKQVKQDLEAQVLSRTEELHSTNIQLKRETTRQQHLAVTLQALLDATNQAQGTEFFQRCAKELAIAYNTQYAMIGFYNNQDGNEENNSIKTLAVWTGDGFAENFTYSLKGTPCQDILNLSAEIIPCGVAAAYPDDHMLVEMGIESYFGAPLVTSSGTFMGIISVMDMNPMDIGGWVKPILALFANRVALEVQRKTTQEELELAASVFNKSADAVLICTKNTKILRVNPAFTRITGYSSEEAIGQTPQILKSGIHPKAFYKNFWETLHATGIWQGEIINRRKDGESFATWQTITVVRDSAGEISQFISIFSDISEKKLTEKRIYDLAHHDIVTGLPNRIFFQDIADTALDHAKRINTQLAILFIDLDHFKLINDTLGHPIGDQLLQQVALRLKKIIDQDNVISRFGGDEFTILVPSFQSTDDVAHIAKRILLSLVEPFLVDNNELIIPASIGIGIYPENGDSISSLLKNADSAMYQAKAHGRNNFQFFTAEMNQQAQERLELERDLRKALKEGEFLLHYQPQVNIASGKITGVEALIRWQHPVMGMISPMNFIPVAESSGLIVPIGKWVLETACDQLQQWNA
ncbi:MAG: diguanylate cyclase, partial [Pseudomonadales bacterium]|nr:diguanylate cyclase [Pseudomonadales bacterium]